MGEMEGALLLTHLSFPTTAKNSQSINLSFLLDLFLKNYVNSQQESNCQQDESTIGEHLGADRRRGHRSISLDARSK